MATQRPPTHSPGGASSRCAPGSSAGAPAPPATARRGHGRSPGLATVGVVHSLVSSVFKAAVRDRRIMANPCEGVRLPRPERVKVVPPTTEEVEQLRDALPDPSLLAVVTFTAGTGLRQGEVFGLTVDRLNMLRREVTVDRQARQTAQSAGPAGAAEDQGEHTDRATPPGGRGCPRGTPRGVPPGAGWACVHARGRADEPSGVRSSVAARRRGRPVSRTARAYTCCGTTTRLCSSGMGSVKTVQARLGHATAAETLDTYSHLWPDSGDRTRQAVDSQLCGTSRGVGDLVGTKEAQLLHNRRSAWVERTSRAVGRVLSRAAVAGDAVTVIHLGWPLPTTSSALPACSGGPPSNARCLGLLRMGFTEPTWSPRPLVVSYTTVSPLLPHR